jgi:hypothetical protein
VVFERELLFSLHVGNSLVPSSTSMFYDLSFLDKIQVAKFPCKYGPGNLKNLEPLVP